jgi:hypothetical protein
MTTVLPSTATNPCAARQSRHAFGTAPPGRDNPVNDSSPHPREARFSGSNLSESRRRRVSILAILRRGLDLWKNLSTAGADVGRRIPGDGAIFSGASRPKKLRGDSALGRVSRRDRTIFSSAKKTLRTDVSVALGPERPERWANNAAILCLDYASLLLP